MEFRHSHLKHQTIILDYVAIGSLLIGLDDLDLEDTLGDLLGDLLGEAVGLFLSGDL